MGGAFASFALGKNLETARADAILVFRVHILLHALIGIGIFFSALRLAQLHLVRVALEEVAHF